MTKIAGIPAFRDINNKICQGINLMDESPKAAVRIWYQAWQEITVILEKTSIKSIDEFDRRFRGTMNASQMIQELDGTLSILSEDDPKYLKERVAFCESVLSHYDGNSDPIWVNDVIRSGLAESYLLMNNREKADELYEAWMERYPTWTTGWIDWSDCFLMSDYLEERPDRVESILRKGIECGGPASRYTLMSRLVEILEYFGREEESLELAKQRDLEQRPPSRSVQSEELLRKIISLGSNFWNLDTESFGRREPCTCGSGKKYKNCCDVEIR